MAELAAEGFLNQPHTSAGRVPTGKAFQVFAASLPEKRVHSDELHRIRENLGEAGSLASRVERCSHMLTEMTGGVAIATAVPARGQVLDQVQLVWLGGQRVLMVVITADKLVRDQLVTLDEPVTQEEMNSVRNYLNANFSGWALPSIQRELRSRLEADSAAYDSILKRLALLRSKGVLDGLLDVSPGPELHLDGASNLVDSDVALTREHLKELFQALEEKRIVLELLERFLAAPAGEVGVSVGLGAPPHALQEMSLIGIKVEGPGGLSARLAVLGPMRMDYSRAMSAVLHVGRALGSLPS